MAAQFDRKLTTFGPSQPGIYTVSEQNIMESGSQQQLFTDPQLLKRIRATTPNRLANHTSVPSQNPIIGRQQAQYVVDSKSNNTSFVVEPKPIHQLYVENTSVPPPTQFIYANPPPTHIHKTFIVGGSGQKLPPTQSIVSGTPIPIPPPLTVNPAFLLSPGGKPLSQMNSHQILIDRSLNRSHSANKVVVSSTTVSMQDFERVQNECRAWQQRYNDLYTKFTTLSSTKDMHADEQINRLRAQNYELQQRLLTYERNQATLHQTVEAYISQLINRHRSSTLKECELLFDRFRLECRQMERDGHGTPY